MVAPAASQVPLSEFFWTDSRQASERLSKTFVLYDGKPCHILAVNSGEDYDDGVPRAVVETETGGRATKILTSPKFNKFRDLPSLGWVNCTLGRYGTKAFWLQRNIRSTRQHGLSSQNVGVFFIGSKNNEVSNTDLNVRDIFKSPDYLACLNGEYPELSEILEIIQPLTSIAYSPVFCVARCKEGIRWLFRKRKKIGMFIGVDTLSLFPKQGFYREEIMADPRFTLNTIREF